MSMPKRMTVNCSKCGKPLSVTVFESINTNYASDVAKQIMSGDLFNVECPHCKYISHLEYDILYHDLNRRAMIWVIHPNSSEYEEKVSEVRTIQKLRYNTLRIVNDMNALKEKVSCLESNRDDKIIELCKVFTTYNLLSQRPDFDFRNAFYTAISGSELIYLYDNEDNELCCKLPGEAYDYLKELYYGSHYAAQFDENYPIVDYEWASSILNSLLEIEAERLAASEEVDEEIKPVNDAPTSNKKVCPKCKAVLPTDSEFCQECGIKLSDPIPEPIQSNAAYIENKRIEEENLKREQEVHRLAERQQQEELERRRTAEIQSERNLAILKRVAVQENVDKRKKIIKIIIISVVAALIAIGIISSAIDSAHNNELRNFATETMNDDYNNVYADIISMEPQYFVYTSYNNLPYDISEIVCRCKTIEGKTIWAAIDVWKYPGGSSISEERNEAQYYSESNPKRIVGRVTSAGDVMDELESRIGDILLLDVTERINK